MAQHIEVRRISGKSLFKVLFVGLLVFHVATTILVILLTLLGVLPLEASTQDVELTSLLGFVGAYLLIGILFSPIWVGVLWLTVWPGLWLYSKFKTTTLSYIDP